jgi:hypothetical protein
MEHQLASRGQPVSRWSNHIGDHTILIIATVLPLILMVIAHNIRTRNGDSLAGWFVGSLLSFGLARFVWRRTGSRVTRALAVLVVCLWLVYDGAAVIWMISGR